MSQEVQVELHIIKDQTKGMEQEIQIEIHIIKDQIPENLLIKEKVILDILTNIRINSMGFLEVKCLMFILQ